MDSYAHAAPEYRLARHPDPRIQAQVSAELHGFGSLLNVGAGTWSYEPPGKAIVAMDRSMEMLRRRPAGAAPCIHGSAEDLPFKDKSFDAALAVLTIHHWERWEDGLQEMKRVSRKRVVLLTWDPDHAGFWLTQDYFPEMRALDARIFPSLASLRRALGSIAVKPVRIPGDCTDGFLGAYWKRPEAYLSEPKRKAISSFARIEGLQQGLSRLSSDLEDGEWERKYGGLRGLAELDIGYRLVTADLG